MVTIFRKVVIPYLGEPGPRKSRLLVTLAICMFIYVGTFAIGATLLVVGVTLVKDRQFQNVLLTGSAISVRCSYLPNLFVYLARSADYRAAVRKLFGMQNNAVVPIAIAAKPKSILNRK